MRRRYWPNPDKTFIGRIERGFDFLGYHFGPAGLAVARETIRKFVERALRLYEQEPGDLSRVSCFGAYVRRWRSWANAGLRGTPRIAGTTLEPGAILRFEKVADGTVFKHLKTLNLVVVIDFDSLLRILYKLRKHCGL